jgi:hypothetical protein
MLSTENTHSDIHVIEALRMNRKVSIQAGSLDNETSISRTLSHIKSDMSID